VGARRACGPVPRRARLDGTALRGRGGPAFPHARRSQSLGGTEMGCAAADARTGMGFTVSGRPDAARARVDARRSRYRPERAGERPSRSRRTSEQEPACVLRADRDPGQGDARHPADRRWQFAFHAVGVVTTMRGGHVELRGDALKIEPSPANYLAGIRSGFYVSAYLRAGGFEAQLSAYLREKFGSRWFASREAGSLL